MRINLYAFCMILLAMLFASVQAQTAEGPMVLRVGPGRAIKTISQAASFAKDGFVVEVDAGQYVGDVATWTQNQLTIRSVGGRVQLTANGVSAEGKAIWVMRGGQVKVQGFDFRGSQVASRNGAGIRLERGQLHVQNCTFIDNENGILTSNDPQVQLDIVDSEFGHNGYGDGLSHNLYVGAIGRLAVTGSYFHHALVGHLLKSRAAINDIRYNRLADGAGGRASYELEFPSGGVAYVVGNIIEQGALTENPNLISYATEEYRWPANALYLVHNTLVDNKPSGGVFLRVKPGTTKLVAVNNLIVGRGRLDSAGPGDYQNNVNATMDLFEQGVPDLYRPKPGARLNGKLAVAQDGINGIQIQPTSQYRNPRGTLTLAGKPHNPGAMQTVGSTQNP